MKRIVKKILSYWWFCIRLMITLALQFIGYFVGMYLLFFLLIALVVDIFWVWKAVIFLVILPFVILPLLFVGIRIYNFVDPEEM